MLVTVDIPDDVLQRAMQMTGTTTPEAAILAIVLQYVRRADQTGERSQSTND